MRDKNSLYGDQKNQENFVTSQVFIGYSILDIPDVLLQVSEPICNYIAEII